MCFITNDEIKIRGAMFFLRFVNGCDTLVRAEHNRQRPVFFQAIELLCQFAPVGCCRER